MVGVPVSDTPHGAECKASEIPNHKFAAYRQAGKSQINSKFQIQIIKTILFRIWVIGIYLEFGAWYLVLPRGYALPYAFLSDFGDDIPSGRKNRHIRFRHFSRDLIHSLLEIIGISKFHHLHLVR